LFLMRLVRVDPNTGLKNIVIFYDDAQNLYGRPRPTWSKLGIDVAGRRTRVMQTCFRNTREIVEFAFNLLLGVKSEVRAETRQFADVKYLEEKGLVEELSDRWRVHFAERTFDTPPEVRLFHSREDELKWLLETISYLTDKEEVRPEDILVVFRTDFDYRNLSERICARCPKLTNFIKPYGKPSNPDKDRYIFEECALTLGTVESVKGYDAPIVFLIGADFMQNDKKGRAFFYVAATRAKMRLYVSARAVKGSLAEEALTVRELLFPKGTKSTSAGS
jgi:superfamily I DNA and RNA helicase